MTATQRLGYRPSRGIVVAVLDEMWALGWCVDTPSLGQVRRPGTLEVPIGAGSIQHRIERDGAVQYASSM